MKHPNTIQRVSWQEAKEALEQGGVHVVVSYRPELSNENGIIYAEVGRFTLSKGTQAIQTASEGTLVDFKKIVEWLIVHQSENVVQTPKELEKAIIEWSIYR